MFSVSFEVHYNENVSIFCSRSGVSGFSAFRVRAVSMDDYDPKA